MGQVSFTGRYLKLIRLTKTTGDAIYLNPELVAVVYKHHTRRDITVVELNGTAEDKTFYVVDSVDNVVKAVEGALNR